MFGFDWLQNTPFLRKIDPTQVRQQHQVAGEPLILGFDARLHNTLSSRIVQRSFWTGLPSIPDTLILLCNLALSSRLLISHQALADDTHRSPSAAVQPQAQADSF